MATGETAPKAHWYAIRTRSRHEKVVATQLEGLEVEHFLPLVNSLHRWSDRKKQVVLPLFPGYAFVRLDYASEYRLRVLKTHGVVGFVGSRGEATPIPDSQIDGVRMLLTQDVPFKNHAFLRIGQRIRIRGGSLDGVEGILIEQKKARTLVLSIEPIQRSISIDLEGYDVEVV
ncbi:MAG TPA: UpxY family transcription antiterminator [Terriglobales bacterium]